MVAGGRSACNPCRDRCRASRRPPAVLGARRVEPAVRARSVNRADLDEEAWDISGTHVTLLENKNLRFTEVLRADDGTRTHDLLHGKRVVHSGRRAPEAARLSRIASFCARCMLRADSRD